MFAQMDKFLPEVKKYLIADQSTPDLNSDWVLLRYDDALPYQQRVLQGIQQVEEDIIVFHHEDMFLYGEPNNQIIEKCCSLIKEQQLDFIKFVRATYRPYETLTPTMLHENVFYCPPDLQFAIQPTLCKKENLMRIYEETPGENIWKFEANSNIVCAKHAFKCAMTFMEGEQMRGDFHWDSHVYPYFATAVVKGKWDFQCYPKKLKSLLDEYNIDPAARGTNV
jgi:hypothetical protein